MSTNTLEDVDLENLVTKDLECGIPTCDLDAEWVGKHLCCGASTKPACDRHKKVVERNFRWFDYVCLVCGYEPMMCSWRRV